MDAVPVLVVNVLFETMHAGLCRFEICLQKGAISCHINKIPDYTEGAVDSSASLTYHN